MLVRAVCLIGNNTQDHAIFVNSFFVPSAVYCANLWTSSMKRFTVTGSTSTEYIVKSFEPVPQLHYEHLSAISSELVSDLMSGTREIQWYSERYKPTQEWLKAGDDYLQLLSLKENTYLIQSSRNFHPYEHDLLFASRHFVFRSMPKYAIEVPTPEVVNDPWRLLYSILPAVNIVK